MRRIEQLINDVKYNTNEQSNRFSNTRFNKLFNDAQQEIQRTVHISNANSKFFAKEVFQDLVSGQEEYDLPSDVYTTSAVNSIARRLVNTEVGVEYFTPLRQLGEKERRSQFGYIIQGSKFLLSPVPFINLAEGVRVNYTKKLPELAVRSGTIKDITADVISLSNFDSEINLTDFNDYFCIVDKDGVIIDQEMVIDSYNEGSGKITTSSTITGSVGDYVVLGKVATTNSELPDACEKYLTIYVERFVHYVNSSRGDLQAASVFTSEEKDSIVELFTHNENDTLYPGIVDNTYLNF